MNKELFLICFEVEGYTQDHVKNANGKNDDDNPGDEDEEEAEGSNMEVDRTWNLSVRKSELNQGSHRKARNIASFGILGSLYMRPH